MFLPLAFRRAPLARALRAAVAAHRPDLVRTLYARHGHAAFAGALRTERPRIAEDALSMLPAATRATVRRRLSRTSEATTGAAALPIRNRQPLHGLLVGLGDAGSSFAR
jgi:hypothetical protein